MKILTVIHIARTSGSVNDCQNFHETERYCKYIKRPRVVLQVKYQVLFSLLKYKYESISLEVQV